MIDNKSLNIEIIAELAQGFQGEPALASSLILGAASALADAAKFQLVFADELATPDYQHYELFKTLEMSDTTWAGLVSLARNNKIELYFDIFGERSLYLSQDLNINTVKLHGTDISNEGFLELVAKSSIPRIMLGVGGARDFEIENALNILKNKEVVILLGFQAYPTDINANQISRISYFVRKWAGIYDKLSMGFADHADPESLTRLSLAATALGAGAKVFEKHLTLGRNMKLEDYESALNPDEFLEFSLSIRDCARAYGGTKEIVDFGMDESEVQYREAIRRHVISSRDIKAGSILSTDDLVLKRSGENEFLTEIQDLYGKKIIKDLKANTPIKAIHLKVGE